MKKGLWIAVGAALLVLVASALPAQAEPINLDLKFTAVTGASFSGEPFIGGLYGPVVPIGSFQGLQGKVYAGAMGAGELSQWRVVRADIGVGGGLGIDAANGKLGVGIGWTARSKGKWWVKILQGTF